MIVVAVVTTTAAAATTTTTSYYYYYSVRKFESSNLFSRTLNIRIFNIRHRIV
jgi:hypothetical protein